MPGWKTSAMGQDKPNKLTKIEKNLDDIKAILLPDDDLLEVGCFHGDLYRALGHENYTGMDLFEDNVIEARKKNPGVRFLRGDLFELTGKWDVIVCCRVLMHLPDFGLAIERLRSCIKRKLIIVIPTGTEDTCALEPSGVYFRMFSKKTVLDSGGVLKEYLNRYSTVIYDPLLP